MQCRNRTLLTLVAAIALVALARPASAGNLVLNGSFESGLAGWTVAGTVGDPYPVTVINYNSATPYPGGAFGEAVPPNTAPTSSPDPVGSHAAYFVSDLATNETLSQTITVVNSGLHQIGFSSYAPANGYANVYDAAFLGKIATVTLANYAIGSGPATTWQTFAGATNLTAGNYLVEFVFNTGGFPAKDVVIDQVYVIEGNPSLPVPDGGATLLSLGIGLVGLRALGKRRG